MKFHFHQKNSSLVLVVATTEMRQNETASDDKEIKYCGLMMLLKPSQFFRFLKAKVDERSS